MMINFSEALAVVILAAGKGKRMNNPDMAKVMALLNGKPLISYVLDEVAYLEPARTIVVVGYQKDSIIEFISSNYQNIEFAEQREQLGTGHAVAQCRVLLENFKGKILILAGDVPLIKSDTLKDFIQHNYNENAAVSVLSVIAPDPTGYGRIIRSDSGDFVKITEHKDADERQKEIKEINSGIFLVDSRHLFSSLSQLHNKNAQGEYYLTDIVEIMSKDKLKICAWASDDFLQFQGINTADDLALAENSILKKQSR